MTDHKIRVSPNREVSRLAFLGPIQERILVLLLMAAMVLQGLSDIQGMSITWDETMYIGLGNYILRNLHIDFLHLEGLHFHPIWTFYLNSIFLLFLHLPQAAFSIHDGSVYTISAGNALLFHSGYRPETILLLARLPILLQSLLLSWVVYRFTGRLFGRAASLLALGALSFDPNFIAHSAIACTDSSITVWLCTTVYCYWLYLQQPSRMRLSLTALGAGITALSKVNGPILLAVFFVAMYIADRFSRREQVEHQSDKLSARSLEELRGIRHLLIIFFGACFLIWAAYGFGLSIDYKSEAEIKAANVHGAKAMIQSTKFIRLPLAPYFAIVANVATWAKSAPRHGYMFGKMSPNGFRTYPFAVFSIKTPVPILVLVIVSLLLWRLLPRADLCAETALAIGCLVPILMAIPDRANCGVRYILPLYPFLYISISRIVNARLPGRIRFALITTICVLLLWNAIESVYNCPNQLAYFNSFFRDPARKYYYLVDSNLDWGNELYALREFAKDRHIDALALDYFGNVDPAEYGIKCRQATEDSKGWVAISATDLAGAYGTHDMSAFRSLRPVACLCGGGMLVYYRQ